MKWSIQSWAHSTRSVIVFIRKVWWLRFSHKCTLKLWWNE